MFHKLISIFFLLLPIASFSQGLSVNSCPEIEKRNNGNGQASAAAGDFSPFLQNNPVAPNVVGTPYQMVPFNPSTKTGNYNFKWVSATPIVNLPVITRVWTTNTSNVTTLSPIVFGPPPPAYQQANAYYANYCFYVLNMPPAGRVTLEFTDPQTKVPAFRCTYDLQSGNPAAEPDGISCTPTISSNPSSQTYCGTGSATFSASHTGTSSYVWQYSTNGGSTWNDISIGGDFTTITASELVVNNRLNYAGNLFRIALTNSCGTRFSTNATLTVNPLPTAIFSGSTSLCGLNVARNLSVNLTGAGPWTFTYTVNGTPTTITNTTLNPFNISVNPSVSTTYVITSVSDSRCSNSAPTGNTSLSISSAPTISPSNVSVCLGVENFSLNYTSSSSPNQYSISTGTRSMTGFSPVTNASLNSSPLSVAIPSSGFAAGVYDFNISVRNSTTGCVSNPTPFTLTVSPQPTVSATASSYTICAGTSANLSASPSNLASYEWTLNPSSTVIGTSSTLNFTINSTATFTVKGTNAGGCYNTAQVTVNTITGSPITITPSSPTICSGNAVELQATGSNTYTWSPSLGLSVTDDDHTVASPTTTTTYTVTGQNTSGCNSIGTVVVTVTNAPISVTASSTICSGGNQTLTASGGSTYAWFPYTDLFTDAGFTTPYNGGNNSIVYSKPTASRTYFVNGTTAAGCVGVASSTVTIAPAPVNPSTSTPSNLIFCTQGTSSFPLNVQLTQAVTSATWAYSTDGITYTSFTSAVTVSGVTFTPSTSGSSPTQTYTNTISGYGQNAYGGARFFRLIIVTNTCTFNYNIKITDTKSSTIPDAPTALQTTVCSGDFTTLTIGALASGSTAQWESSPNNSTWTAISGATSASYTTGNLTATTYYRVKYSSGSCAQTSAVATITIVSAQAANTITPSSNCTDGESNIVITGTAISGGIYQWQRSTTSSTDGFSDIIGAIGQNYTLPTNIVNTTTWFRRRATNGTCLNNTSSASPIYAPVGSNTLSSASLATCGSSFPSTLITGSTPNGGSGSYTYQWQFSTNGTSFSNVPSAGTSKDYTTSSQNTSYFYRRLVNSSDCQTETSSTVFLKLSAIPTITVTPSTTLCVGQTLSLTAGGGNSYTWSPATELNATTGGTVFTTPTTTRSYTVTGTDVNNCTNTASTTITMTSLPSTPTLSNSSATICSGSTANLSSFLTSDGSNVWFSVPESNLTYQLGSPASVGNQGTYYVYAVNNGCYSSNNASFTLTVNDVSAPSPLQSSAEVCAPNTVNLTNFNPVATAGTTLVWKTGSSSGSSNVSSPTAANDGTYYLFAYSPAGGCFGSASSPFTVTQNTLPSISLSSSNVSICEPNSINLNSYLNTVNGIEYGWYSTNTNPPSLADIVNPASGIDETGTFYVFAKNSSTNCWSSSPATFNLTVNPNPELTFEAPEVDCANSAIDLEVNITNGLSSPTYQWKLYNNSTEEWDNLSNSGIYSGVNTNVLSITSNTGLDGNAYKCFVTAEGCSSTSNIGVVGVSDPSAPVVVVSEHPDCFSDVGEITVTSLVSDGLTIKMNDGSYVSDYIFGNLNPGVYTFVAKDYLGCISPSSQTTINPIPEKPLQPLTHSASECIYKAPAGWVEDVNGYEEPVFKWYNNNSTTSALQNGTSITYLTPIMSTATFYVSVVHPITGCESPRSTLTNTVIDPLGAYNPVVNDYVWKGGATADINDWMTITNWYQFDGDKYITVNTIPALNDNVIIPPTSGCIPAQPAVKNMNTFQFDNLEIKEGGTLTIEGNGILNVSGNWVNNGTFIRGNGTVNFVGEGEHVIDGTSLTQFNNVVINKTPAQDAEHGVIYLNRSTEILGTLTLTDGLLDIRTYDLNMGSRTVTGGGTNTYVRTSSSGRLQRQVPNSIVYFPIGRESYNPARLNNTGTSDLFSIRVVDIVTDNADEVGTLTSFAVVSRTWYIDENTPGGSNVNLGLYWDQGNGATQERNSFQRNIAYIAHYAFTKSKWENKLGNPSSNSPYCETNNIIDFSPFTISSDPDFSEPFPLPVVLLNATINCQNGKVLKWSTASEKNSDYFTVEGSVNGEIWREIARVQSAGYSQSKIDYVQSFDDIYNYIRLSQTDFDGTTTELITLNASCEMSNNNPELRVYPNPNNGSFVISYDVKIKSDAFINIIDVQGRAIFSQYLLLEEGLNFLPVELDNFKAGVYFVQANVNGKMETIKILINKN